MKNRLYLLSFFTILLVSFSCSNEQQDDVTEYSSNISHHISPEQAISHAISFVQKCNVQTRKTKVFQKSVDGITVISGRRYATRTLDPSNNLDTLLYVIQFKNNQGY